MAGGVVRIQHGALKPLYRLLRSMLLFIIVLLVGYAVAPLLVFIPSAPLSEVSIQLGTFLFLVIAALFVYSLAGFGRSILYLLRGPKETSLLGLGLDSIRRTVGTRLLLNLLGLSVLLSFFWIASPLVLLIPEVGAQILASLHVAVGAVVALFFWNAGGALHTYLGRRLDSVGETHERGTPVGLRDRLLKALLYLILTAAVLVVAYSLYPLIQLGEGTVIPSTPLTIGQAYWIVALSAAVLSVFSFARNLVGVFGLGPDVLARAFPFLTSSRVSIARRAAVNLLLLLIVLTGFLLSQPYVQSIPRVGTYISAAGQVVIGSLIVLFFWDVGRSIFSQMESELERIGER
jgi:hypothetical protein